MRAHMQFCVDIYRKNDPDSATPISCEPGQSKRTWTFHKSHVVWKFTGKMPDPPENISIKHRALYCDRKNLQCVIPKARSQ